MLLDMLALLALLGPAGAAGAVGATGTAGPIGPTGLNWCYWDCWCYCDCSVLLGPAGPIGLAGLLPNGAAAGNTPYWNGASWVVNNSNIFNNGGNVGVGTATPIEKFSVVGPITRLQNDIFQLYNQANTNFGFFVNPDFGSETYIGTGAGSTNPMHTYLGGAIRTTVTQAGNFGIGLSPTSKLHVKSSGTNTTPIVATASSTSFPLFTVSENNAGHGYASLYDDLGAENARITGNSAGNNWMMGDLGVGNTISKSRLTVNTPNNNVANFYNTATTAFNPANIAIDDDAGLVLHSSKVVGEGLLSSLVATGGTVGNYSGRLLFWTQASGVVDPVERMRIQGTGEVGIGTSTPGAKLEVAGQVKITGGVPGAGKVLTSDATGLATWTTPSGGTVTGSGTTNYVPKFTAGTAIGNSQIQDNANCVSINTAVSNLYRLSVYDQQLTADGDGQYSEYSFRTRDIQNDGTGYTMGLTNAASGAYNFWGDVYSFGMHGNSYGDYNRTGGVLGSTNSGNWGSLGYKNSASVYYGVYGSTAYANGAGALPTTASSGIGGGFFGTIGSVTKGSVVGQMNIGELFAAYNNGDVYTSGKQVELVATNDKVIPSYAVTSYEAKVYNNGKIQLVNGTATVRFGENYTQLLGEAPIVTASPMGACNGVYVSAVTKDGFEIKEQNNGTSTVDISWISVGTRVDANSSEVPAILTNKNFNRNLGKALFNDSNTKQSGEAIWWNGKELEMGTMPKELSEVKRVDSKVENK